MASPFLIRTQCEQPPDGLDLKLDGGGIVLEGSNGSGKSSATLAALGLIARSGGEVLVNGRAPGASEWEGIRASVAYLPQRCFVAPSETLAWHATLVGVTDSERLRRACGRMGLSGRLDGDDPFTECLGRLSGGERQRFLIARALAREADWLVLDEPEVGLDTRGRELLREILREEATVRLVLLVAHDPSVAPPSFSRVACGTPSDSQANVRDCAKHPSAEASGERHATVTD